MTFVTIWNIMISGRYYKMVLITLQSGANCNVISTLLLCNQHPFAVRKFNRCTFTLSVCRSCKTAVT